MSATALWPQNEGIVVIPLKSSHGLCDKILFIVFSFYLFFFLSLKPAQIFCFHAFFAFAADDMNFGLAPDIEAADRAGISSLGGSFLLSGFLITVGKRQPRQDKAGLEQGGTGDLKAPARRDEMRDGLPGFLSSRQAGIAGHQPDRFHEGRPFAVVVSRA